MFYSQYMEYNILQMYLNGINRLFSPPLFPKHLQKCEFFSDLCLNITRVIIMKTMY